MFVLAFALDLSKIMNEQAATRCGKTRTLCPSFPTCKYVDLEDYHNKIFESLVAALLAFHFYVFFSYSQQC